MQQSLRIRKLIFFPGRLYFSILAAQRRHMKGAVIFRLRLHLSVFLPMVFEPSHAGGSRYV